ncbi:MAG TPA: flagellar hook-length control protein FliK [Methylophilus sp.]|uniref:flagellar hook-length control protein FliK n=1 Tax=Methylophilus sp. TaxID=29541 RepID=UPI002C771906|nr:flagellar hook-length control protein FliK [Methylophilus sp.]HSH87811.1 flagellar hook-length control protein FliK [Methylophilus sp.]
MTFLNSAGLLNMGNADAVKTAASNTPQDFQANQSDEFAQALRKQLQQANKPASTIVPPADKNKQSVKEPSNAQSAQTNNVKNEAAAKEPAPKDQPKTNSATAKDNSADDSKTDKSQEIDEQAATAGEASGIDETALDRKRKLITNLQATDPTDVSITPWMQTMTAMIAMRQSSGQGGVDEKADLSVDSAILSSPKGEFVVDPNATALPEEALADKTSAANMPVGAQPANQSAALDAKTPSTADGQAPVADKPVNFSETLGIAKSVADAVSEAVITDKAVAQALNADIQVENTNTVTAPAAQALPNSPWLNTAGISQNANVIMSQVSTPFGNERWQTAMNQHVLNMVGSGDDVASLTLSPPDLGPIQVVLKVDNQSVNTSFITDNPLVRQALEDGMQDLRDRMQSQGLELGQTFVGNGHQAEQHFEQQSAKGNGRATAETEAVAATQTAVKTTVSRGLVDTFA